MLFIYILFLNDMNEKSYFASISFMYPETENFENRTFKWLS